MKKFAVLIVNWNGARDTIECLRSILEGDPAAVPVVVDNGSEDDSVSRIADWASAGGVRLLTGRASDPSKFEGAVETSDVVMVLAGENLGFARGCNLGLGIVGRLALSEVVFLNNDTVVEPRALGKIVSLLRDEPAMFASFPQIRIAGAGRIWNCGGRISRLGFRRYWYANAPLGSVHLPPRINCTFFTGCCFAVRTAEFLSRGGLTERFFFGEEDFELGLWMLDHGKRAVCLTEAVVDHKVSASIARASRAQSRMVYVHYLNRFIHMRLRLGSIRWLVWLCLYLPYIVQLLWRTSAVGVGETPRFVRRLLQDAWRNDGVDRDLFLTIVKGQRW